MQIFRLQICIYYTPPQEFDVIVFNEAFYYINDAVRAKVLKRILGKLKQGGILINSIYKEGVGCWEYFDNPELEQLDFTTVKTKKEGTYWKVGVYRKLLNYSSDLIIPKLVHVLFSAFTIRRISKFRSKDSLVLYPLG